LLLKIEKKRPKISKRKMKLQFFLKVRLAFTPWLGQDSWTIFTTLHILSNLRICPIESNVLGTTTFSITTFSITPFSITTFSITTFSIMTFGITTFSIMAFSITTFSITTFSITAFSITALSITTFGITTLSIMSLFATLSIIDN
jgi:hypothetical protein